MCMLLGVAVIASAPGKLILTGEYAVLDGAPALVIAVDRRATAQHHADRPAGSSPFLLAVARELAVRYGADSPGARAALEIAVDSSAFYDGTQKLGLGSSAAVTVAATALALAIQHGDDRTAPTPLRAKMLARQRRREIFELALAAHANAQGAKGARGSGADIAAAVHGGAIVYTLPVHTILDAPGFDQLKDLASNLADLVRSSFAGDGPVRTALAPALELLNSLGPDELARRVYADFQDANPNPSDPVRTSDDPVRASDEADRATTSEIATATAAPIDQILRETPAPIETSAFGPNPARSTGSAGSQNQTQRSGGHGGHAEDRASDDPVRASDDPLRALHEALLAATGRARAADDSAGASDVPLGKDDLARPSDVPAGHDPFRALQDALRAATTRARPPLPIVERRSWPPGVVLIPFFTGVSADTATLVSQVEAARVARPEAVNAALSAIAEASRAACAALAAPAGFGDTALLGALRLAAVATDRLAEATGVALVPACVSAAHSAMQALGGTAKTTGAGGGDIAIAVIPASADVTKAANLLIELGCQPLQLTVDDHGVDTRIGAQ